MNDVRTLVADHEAWLGRAIPLDPAGLRTKHALMRQHELSFLRGSSA